MTLVSAIVAIALTLLPPVPAHPVKEKQAVAFDFSYPNKPANERGWGPGAPNCQFDKMTALKVRGTPFPGGVRREIVELTERLLLESLDRGYVPNLMDPGCWAFGCRMTKRSDGTLTNTPSNHSWGLAVDINAPRNPFNKNADHEIGPRMAELFKEYGFRWLGPPIGDWMHFDFAGTPADARNMLEKARRNHLGEDPMTEAEKARLKAVEEVAKQATAALNGVEDFLAGQVPPEQSRQERKQMYRALTRAAKLPKPTTPTPIS